MRFTALTRMALLLVAACAIAGPASAQDVDTTSYPTTVRANVSITNKGIATVPSLTLGKPAAIFEVVVSRRNFSFEPQFRYGLDGKPWAFLPWVRYKLFEGERLRVGIGAHPAISFRGAMTSDGGVREEILVARRYLATEVSPTYAISRNVSIGAYHLYSYGVDKAVTRHTNLVSLRGGLSTALSDEYTLRIAPQAYYLRMDDRDGFYLNSGVTITKRDFPISVSATYNKIIETTVLGGSDNLWNVSVSYQIH